MHDQFNIYIGLATWAIILVGLWMMHFSPLAKPRRQEQNWENLNKDCQLLTKMVQLDYTSLMQLVKRLDKAIKGQEKQMDEASEFIEHSLPFAEEVSPIDFVWNIAVDNADEIYTQAVVSRFVYVFWLEQQVGRMKYIVRDYLNFPFHELRPDHREAFETKRMIFRKRLEYLQTLEPELKSRLPQLETSGDLPPHVVELRNRRNLFRVRIHRKAEVAHSLRIKSRSELLEMSKDLSFSGRPYM